MGNLSRGRLSHRTITPEVRLFLGVLILRLFTLVRLTGSSFLLPDHGDMHFYNDWALRILSGQLTDYHAFYGLPLYAYLLAGLYKIVGYNPFVPGLIQVCLDAGTAVLIYRLGVVVFPSRASGTAPFLSRRGEVIGVVAALGWAIFQPAAAYSIVLMPTVWLVFVFWFVVWEIVRREEAPRLPGWFWLGLLVGFAAMGIATVLFLLPLLLLACFTRWGNPARRPNPWRARLAAAAVLFLGLGLGTSPSWIHNYFVARDPVLLSAHSGVNFWIGNNPWATGYPRFPPGLHAGQEAMLQDSISGAERAVGRPLKRSEVSAYWSKNAETYIRNNFGQWLQLLGTKIAKFWNAFQYDDLSIITRLREEGVIFPGVRFGIIAALALPGLFLTWGRFPLSRWVACAILLHLLSLLSVFVTERYRMAAVPGLLLFAAAGVWELWSAKVSANYRRCLLCLGLLLLSTWLVSRPQREPSLWALDSYNSGLQALQSDNLDLAEEKLNFAYSYASENAELNFALGNLRLAQGQKTAAKEFYYTTLRLDPRHEGSYNNLGVMALDEKRWSLAAKFFFKALQQSPADAKTHYLLAKASFGEGDIATARIEVKRALSLKPKQQEFLRFRDQLNAP